MNTNNPVIMNRNMDLNKNLQRKLYATRIMQFGKVMSSK